MADPTTHSKRNDVGDASAETKPTGDYLETSKPLTGQGVETAPYGLIVGVGASAGGLEAFSELLENLPEITGMAFVLVQHLDPTHSSVLEEILSRKTKISVTEATDGMVVERNHVYVMPANADMIIKDGLLRLSTRTVGRGQHRPIDSFFHSLAEER